MYSITYEDDSSRLVVTVGRPRIEYRRKTGPRGGRIRNADHESLGHETGSEVAAIIDAGTVFYVYSYGPDHGEWENPSMVGKSPPPDVVYFDGPVDGGQ